MTTPTFEVAFDPAQKPGLQFEVFKFSELLARLDAMGSPHRKAPVRMDFHVVYVGLRGRGDVLVDFQRVPIGAGWLTVVRRGAVHQYTPSSRKAEAWMMLFTPELLAVDINVPLSLLTPHARAAMAVHDASSFHVLCEQAAREYARPVDDLQRPLLASLCRTLLLHAERIARATTPAVPSALTRFQGALDRDITRTRSVAHYARASGVSTRRLGELLQAHTGQTTKQAIAERALLEAKRLIAHSDLSIKEIAARTGFSESTNFVKFFRNRAGESPLAFRQRFAS